MVTLAHSIALLLNKRKLIVMMERILHFFALYPIDFIAHIGSILPIIIGVLRYKYLTGNIKAIWFFFIVSFIKDSYSLLLIFTAPNNLYIQNIEPIYQTIIIGSIFYYSFDTSFTRRIITVSTVFCTLTTVLYYKDNEASSVSLSTFRLFAIVLALAYFGKVMMDMRVKNIMKHSLFWFTSGLLIYTAGTFFIMLLSEYWYQGINKVPIDVFDKYWNSSQLLLVLFTLLSTVGIWFSKYDVDNVT